MGEKKNIFSQYNICKCQRGLNQKSLLKFHCSCMAVSNEVRKRTVFLWLCSSLTNYQTSLLLNHGRKSIGDGGEDEGKPRCLSEREQIMDLSACCLSLTSSPTRSTEAGLAFLADSHQRTGRVIWLYLSKRVWLSLEMFYSSDGVWGGGRLLTSVSDVLAKQVYRTTSYRMCTLA